MLLLPEQILSERRGELLDVPEVIKKPGPPQQKSKACRRLDFGPSDDTRSRQFVAELLEKMREEDRIKWNFDFSTERPSVTTGNATGWEWTRVTNARRKLDFGGEDDGATEEEEDERPKWMFQILEKLHREQVERWNFDFREERPLDGGDWEWTKMGEEEKQTGDSEEAEKVQEGEAENTRKRDSKVMEAVTSEGESSSKLPRIEERTG